MSRLWLIKRQPRPSWHRAPYHDVIVCPRRDMAKWEAGATDSLANVWSHDAGCTGGGWLIERWNGLDIDYGHIVRGMPLPDGTVRAFEHDATKEPWTLLRGAVWYSSKKIPQRWADAGFVYAPDYFTQQHILDTKESLRAEREQRGCATGFGRPIPAWWPDPTDVPNGQIVERAEVVCSQERGSTQADKGLAE